MCIPARGPGGVCVCVCVKDGLSFHGTITAHIDGESIFTELAGVCYFSYHRVYEPVAVQGSRRKL